MRIMHASDPVYAPNSKGGPVADSERYPENAAWSTDGEFLRAAYTLRRDDNDCGQPNALVNRVMDDAARERLVNNVAGHLLSGVEEPVLSRAFESWSKVDASVGQRIKNKVLEKKLQKRP